MDEVACTVSYILYVPVKYTYMVFPLDARHKMTPYFREDNIPWTEEIITKLLQISPVWFHSKALKIFSTFLICRGWWSYFQLFRKKFTAFDKSAWPLCNVLIIISLLHPDSAKMTLTIFLQNRSFTALSELLTLCFHILLASTTHFKSCTGLKWRISGLRIKKRSCNLDLI